MRIIEKKRNGGSVRKYQASGKFINPFTGVDSPESYDEATRSWYNPATKQWERGYGIDSMSQEEINQLDLNLQNMETSYNQSMFDFYDNLDRVSRGERMQINPGLKNYIQTQMIQAGDEAANNAYNDEVLNYYLNNNSDDSSQAIKGWKNSNNARATAQLPYAKQLDYLSGTKDAYQKEVLAGRDFENQSIDNGVTLSTALPVAALASIYGGPAVWRHLKSLAKDVPTAYGALFKKGAEGQAARYILGRTGLDVLGADVANETYQNVTGQTWGETLNQATNGVIKPGLGELLNPMYIMPGAAMRRIEKAYPLVFKNLNPSLTVEAVQQAGVKLPKTPTTWSDKALLFGLLGSAASEYTSEDE